jgi:hypothetical protein
MAGERRKQDGQYLQRDVRSVAQRAVVHGHDVAGATSRRRS